MITVEEFDKLQILLGRKGKPRKRKYEIPYKGNLVCGDCGGNVTAEPKFQIICSECKHKFHKSEKRLECPRCKTLIEVMKNPKILNYTYLHCNKKKDPHCRQGSVEIRDLEKQIMARIDRFEIPKELRDWAVKYLHEYTDQLQDNHVASIKSASDRLKGLIVQKNNPGKYVYFGS